MNAEQTTELATKFATILAAEKAQHYAKLWLEQYATLGYDTTNARRFASLVANRELKPVLVMQLSKVLSDWHAQDKTKDANIATNDTRPSGSHYGLAPTLLPSQLSMTGIGRQLEQAPHLVAFLVLLQKLQGELQQHAGLVDGLLQLLRDSYAAAFESQKAISQSDLSARLHTLYLAMVEELGPSIADTLIAKALQMCDAHQPSLRVNARELL